MAGLQYGESYIMIDSVVWAQYINVTDRQIDRHIAIANAEPMNCVGQQKLMFIQGGVMVLFKTSDS